MSATGTNIAPPVKRPTSRLDIGRIRKDFPILQTTVRGKPLVFLDTAASAQKPQAVIDAVSECYSRRYANIHRGLYKLSADVTAAFEGAREKVAKFINAPDSREVVFVRNATEAINLVAYAWGGANVGPGDEILISTMEHHANIVPWQMLCERTGATLRVAPINDRGELIRDAIPELLTSRTKILSIVHVSNALGTVNPVSELVAAARARDVPVLLDGAQAVPHMSVDVQELGCDFYAFSGHKLFGPSGAGVLWGRLPVLEAMPPFLGGGEMIETVSFEGTTYKQVPHRFEAGTPDIAGVIGLGAAIDYLESIGMARISEWEAQLLAYASTRLQQIPGLRVIGTADEKAAVVSFVVDGVHPHDMGQILDQDGICVRAGHHCAQPIMERFGVPATTRASFAFYNTPEDIDALVAGVRTAQEMFA